MNTEVRIQDDGAVRWLRLNRPERLNAVCEELYTALEQALMAADTDPEVRVLVLAGEGRAFCAGADLKRHREGRTEEQRRRYLWQEQRVCRQLFTHSKPIVCALHGYAIGAGLELALNADWRIGADSLQVGLPELGIGNFVGGGITALLPNLVGLANARRLLLQPNRKFSALEAERLGILDAVVADDDLTRCAEQRAHELAELAPASLMTARRQLRDAVMHHYDRALAEEWQAMVAATGGADWQKNLEHTP